MADVFPRKSVRAFTLVELLATLTIVGILTVLSITAIHNMVDGALTAKCLNNLRNIGVAAMSYSADHDGATLTFSDHPELVNGEPPSWYLQVAAYLGGDPGDPEKSCVIGMKSLACPARKSTTPNPPWQNWGSWEPVVGHPWPYVTDYGYNSLVNDSTAKLRGDPVNLVKMVSVSHPSKTPMIQETANLNNFNGTAWALPPPKSDNDGALQAFSQRHNGGSHVLWFDGHISYFKYLEYAKMVYDPNSPWQGDDTRFMTGNW
ncbi:MAG: hypothetical protein BGO12_04355 [Verrucomicrobia bacterium 61-8]|nr:MAG: hypothetical protein BGO12_04355 [Verrucomicrobia bacterium 61-8]